MSLNSPVIDRLTSELHQSSLEMDDFTAGAVNCFVDSIYTGDVGTLQKQIFEEVNKMSHVFEVSWLTKWCFKFYKSDVLNFTNNSYTEVLFACEIASRAHYNLKQTRYVTCFVKNLMSRDISKTMFLQRYMADFAELSQRQLEMSLSVSGSESIEIMRILISHITAVSKNKDLDKNSLHLLQSFNTQKFRLENPSYFRDIASLLLEISEVSECDEVKEVVTKFVRPNSGTESSSSKNVVDLVETTEECEDDDEDDSDDEDFPEVSTQTDVEPERGWIQAVYGNTYPLISDNTLQFITTDNEVQKYIVLWYNLVSEEGGRVESGFVMGCENTTSSRWSYYIEGCTECKYNVQFLNNVPPDKVKHWIINKTSTHLNIVCNKVTVLNFNFATDSDPDKTDVHGNLILKLKNGREIRTNSVIMSLNSPVIDRLTSELHQSSLEMDDFTAGAVNCFVDSIYTGDVGTLQKQIFEDVNKMSHVFEVSWLTKRCFKFYKSDVLNFTNNSYKEVLFACEIASRAHYNLKQSCYVTCFVKNLMSRDISKTMFLQRYMANFAELSQRQLEMSLSVSGSEYIEIMRILISHITAVSKNKDLDKNSLHLLKSFNTQKFRLENPSYFRDVASLLLEISEVSECDEVKEVVTKFVRPNSGTESSSSKNVVDLVETTEECEDDDEDDSDDEDFPEVSTQTDVEPERGWIQAVYRNTYPLISDNTLQFITTDNEVQKYIGMCYNLVSEEGGHDERWFGMRCENTTSSQWSYYIEGCTVCNYNVQFLNNVPPDKVKHWIINKTSTHLNIVCNKVTVLNFNFATDSDPDKTDGKHIWSREAESSSLEMDDFTVGAVNCFVDSIYTGDVGTLQKQIFEDVNKMSHVFDVSWLTKMCLKFYKSDVLNFTNNSYQEVLFACEIASRAHYNLKQTRYVACFVKNLMSRDISRKIMFLQRYMADFAELSKRQFEMSLSMARNDFSLIMVPLTSHLTMNLKCRNLDKNSMYLLEACDVQKFRQDHPDNFDDAANLLLEISEVSECDEVKEVVRKFVHPNSGTEASSSENVVDLVETTEECKDDDEDDSDDEDFPEISTQTDVEPEREVSECDEVKEVVRKFVHPNSGTEASSSENVVDLVETTEECEDDDEDDSDDEDFPEVSTQTDVEPERGWIQAVVNKTYPLISDNTLQFITTDNESSLEMDDFTAGAVNCFVDSIYTGDIGTLQNQIFEDVNKMSHVFEVSWLTKRDVASLLLEISEVSECDEVKEVVRKFVHPNSGTEASSSENVDDLVETTEECEDDDEDDSDDEDFPEVSTQTDVEPERGWIQAVLYNTYPLIFDNTLQFITTDNGEQEFIGMWYNLVSEEGGRVERWFEMRCENRTSSQWSYYIGGCTVCNYNVQFLNNVPPDKVKHWIINKTSTHLNIVCNKVTVLNFNFATHSDPDKTDGKHIWSREAESVEIDFDSSLEMDDFTAGAVNCFVDSIYTGDVGTLQKQMFEDVNKMSHVFEVSWLTKRDVASLLLEISEVSECDEVKEVVTKFVRPNSGTESSSSKNVVDLVETTEECEDDDEDDSDDEDFSEVSTQTDVEPERVHGNLILKLKNGQEIRTNSVIMSLNSPVIDRLTSELHQSSLEMDDFTAGAVNCFVDSIYTGDVGTLQKQIFEDVNKMSHVFEVSWLTKRCLKFYKSDVLNFTNNSYQEVLFACEIASRAHYNLKQTRYVTCFVKNLMSRDISRKMFLQRYMADFAELSKRQLEMSLSMARNDFSLIMVPLTYHLTMNLKCRNLDKNSMYLLEACDVQKFRQDHPDNFDDAANLLLEISEVSECDEVKEVVRKFVRPNSGTEAMSSENVVDLVETTEECEDDDEDDSDDEDFPEVSTQTDVEPERVHGNLVLKLKNGQEIRANSVIMSLNSPVIDRLTSELHQSSLEMDDFTAGAVNCFVDSIYTGDVGTLQKQIFEDVNKMSHVFEVSWLTKSGTEAMSSENVVNLVETTEECEDDDEDDSDDEDFPEVSTQTDVEPERGKSQPKLDQTKIFELNAYLTKNKPDVVVLNETWLNKSVKDTEIIGDHYYDVYRNDRSEVTHPADPNNPRKFRKFGGGVLIAVRSNINASFKRLSMRRGAEILAVELTVGNNKYVVCTVYRVDNLGEANHDCIVQSIKSMYDGRILRKIFIVGDLNLSSINWPETEDTQENIDRIDRLFLNSFSELGLHQCVLEPTHVKGRTLDILLTNFRELVKDVKVDKFESICQSDHYPVCFKVNVSIKNKKVPKRKIYNFKKACWDRLNDDLCKVPWSGLIDRTDPEVAWTNFKEVLFTLVDKHIPKITVKNDFDAPWFDAECFEAYRSKERAHKKFKLDSSLANELKRNSTRSHFKHVCNEKMRDNLYNSDDPASITKKFWAHVKSKSKNHRLPECMSLNGVFRNTPSDKANLFNSYFFDQFSEASNYDISIDWTNDSLFDIVFEPAEIKRLLSSMNSNKACGPDGIHGKILMHCAVGLANPLSMLFRLSYNSGSLPKDWRVANVVPVHKKGNIPISREQNMVANIRVPAKFSKKYLNSPVHGNLILNLKNGQEIRTNSVIMSLNSPVIDRLTSELHQSSLEMDDFTAGAVNCFVDSIYTGDVGTLQKQIFEDVNKMSHVFEVSWLTKRCLKFYKSDVLNFTNNSYKEVLFACEIASRAHYNLKQTRYVTCFVKNLMSRDISKTMFLQRYMANFSELSRRQIEMSLSVSGSESIEIMRIIISHITAVLKNKDLDKNSLHLLQNFNTQKFRLENPSYFRDVASLLLEISEVSECDEVKEVVTKFVRPNSGTGASSSENVVNLVKTTKECEDDDEDDSDDEDFPKVSTQTDVEPERGWIQAVYGNTYPLISDNTLQFITTDNEVQKCIGMWYNLVSEEGGRVVRGFEMRCENTTSSQWSYYIEGCTVYNYNVQFLNNVPPDKVKHWIINKTSTHLNIVCNKVTVLNFNFATDSDPDKTDGKHIWSREAESVLIHFDVKLLLIMQ
ncbi:hypothetical protein ACHWQZ_G018338 [Mnemiopsis leidyi]